jgi:hypothetical protein
VHQRKCLHLYSAGIWGDLIGKHVFNNASNKALEMKLDAKNPIGVQLGFNCTS